MYANVLSPEGALSRVDAFVRLGRNKLAVEVILEVLKSKSHRSFGPVHETIMQRFASLCVAMRRSDTAKEGLYQYRRICQKHIPSKFDLALTNYLDLVEEGCQKAPHEADETQDADDESVEPIGQGPQENVTVNQWLRFAWDSYKQLADLLRNDSLRRKLYQKVVNRAMKFCVTYDRKMDLKKLRDIVRHHWEGSGENSCSPEMQNMQLEIRLALFEHSVQIKFWREVINFAESLLEFSDLIKRKSSFQARYLQHLAQIFHGAGNDLFHACALQKLFLLIRDHKKNVDASELQRLASQVLCATLAIPLSASDFDIVLAIEADADEVKRQEKFAHVLSCSAIPSRRSLVGNLRDIVQHVGPELKSFYRLLEVEFQPMDLPTNAQVHLDFIKGKEELIQYSQKLQDVAIIKFIEQISRMFDTIDISHLNSMIPLLDADQLQGYVTKTAKEIHLDVLVSHMDNSLIFNSKVDVKRFDVLAAITAVLEKSVAIICKEDIKEDRDQIRLEIIESHKIMCEKNREKLLSRMKEIESLKSVKEDTEAQAEKERKAKEEAEKKLKIEAETVRFAKEAEEREKQRKIDEQRQIQKKILKDKVAEIRKTAIGSRALADVDDKALENMTMEDVVAKQVQQFDKEKKDNEHKLRLQERSVDFYERAKRLEEIPLLLKKCEEIRNADKDHWEKAEKERVDEILDEIKFVSETKLRLGRLMEDEQDYKEKVYNEKLAIYENMISEERTKLLLERKKIRKEERRNQWAKEKEEKIQREKEREARAKKEQQEREQQEKLRQLNLQAEKQRQRELEIEERERQKRQAVKPAPTQKYVPPKGNNRWNKPAEPERVERNFGREDKPADGRRAPRNDDAPRGEDRRRNNDGPSNNEGWRTRGNNNSTRPSINSQKKDEPKRTDDGGSWRRR